MEIPDKQQSLEEKIKTTITDLENLIVKDLLPELQELKRLAQTDALTEILNRRGVKEEFEALFKEALFGKENPDVRKSFKVKDFSVIFLDVDNFKLINDRYGHEAGDAVLRLIVSILKKNSRDIDMIGRYGGEEFVVAFIGMSEDEAFKKAEKIRKQIQGSVSVPAAPKETVTVSIGIASVCQSPAASLDELIKLADKAMYEAKKNRGKNNTVRWTEIAS